MSEFDFDFLSLALATVGLLFICFAAVNKKPRHILEEAFGLYRGGLRDLRASVFKRNQIVMGFCCVVCAIVVNLFSTGQPEVGGYLGDLGVIPKAACLIGFMTALCGILNYFSRLWSKAAFRSLVHEVVTEYQWPFEENMVLTREIGKLLSIPQSDNDTVEAYVARIRSHLKIPLDGSSTSSRLERRLSRLG